MNRSFRSIILAAFGGSLCQIVCSTSHSLSVIQLEQANELVELVGKMGSGGNESDLLPQIGDLVEEFEIMTIDKTLPPFSMADMVPTTKDDFSAASFQYFQACSEFLDAVNEASKELDSSSVEHEGVSASTIHGHSGFHFHHHHHHHHHLHHHRRCRRRCFWRFGIRRCPLRCHGWLQSVQNDGSMNHTSTTVAAQELPRCAHCAQLHSFGVDALASTQEVLLDVIGGLVEDATIQANDKYELMRVFATTLRSATVASGHGLDNIGNAYGVSSTSMNDIVSETENMNAAASKLLHVVDEVVSRITSDNDTSNVESEESYDASARDRRLEEDGVTLDSSSVQETSGYTLV